TVPIAQPPHNARSSSAADRARPPSGECPRKLPWSAPGRRRTDPGLSVEENLGALVGGEGRQEAGRLRTPPAQRSAPTGTTGANGWGRYRPRSQHARRPPRRYSTPYRRAAFV